MNIPDLNKSLAHAIIGKKHHLRAHVVLCLLNSRLPATASILACASQRQLCTRASAISCVRTLRPEAPHRDAAVINNTLVNNCVIYTSLDALGLVESLKPHIAEQFSAVSGNELYNTIRKLRICYSGNCGYVFFFSGRVLITDPRRGL